MALFALQKEPDIASKRQPKATSYLMGDSENVCGNEWTTDQLRVALRLASWDTLRMNGRLYFT